MKKEEKSNLIMIHDSKEICMGPMTVAFTSFTYAKRALVGVK